MSPPRPVAEPGTTLFFLCAAFPAGCMSKLALPAPAGFELPPGQPGSREYLSRLGWWLVHELDGRVARWLREHGWCLSRGEWVCGDHPVR